MRKLPILSLGLILLTIGCSENSNSHTDGVNYLHVDELVSNEMKVLEEQDAEDIAVSLKKSSLEGNAYTLSIAENGDAVVNGDGENTGEQAISSGLSSLTGNDLEGQQTEVDGGVASSTGVTTAQPGAREVSNPDSIYVIVNKTNKLSSSFVPSDLVSVTLPKIDGTDIKIKKVVNTALNALASDFKTEKGLAIAVRSGYRSFTEQQSSFQANNQNESYSAKPGHSEHQTGLAVDVVVLSEVNKVGSIALNENNKSNQPLYEWLKVNAYRYGFIVRYEKNKTNYHGYSYEPWHLRFVGKELAQKIKNANYIALEEAYIRGFMGRTDSNQPSGDRGAGTVQ